jgi:hypothetical protein
MSNKKQYCHPEKGRAKGASSLGLAGCAAWHESRDLRFAGTATLPGATADPSTAHPPDPHNHPKRSGSEILCGRFAQDDIFKFMNNPGKALLHPDTYLAHFPRTAV